jgi:hypothetical protein
VAVDLVALDIGIIVELDVSISILAFVDLNVFDVLHPVQHLFSSESVNVETKRLIFLAIIPLGAFSLLRRDLANF